MELRGLRCRLDSFKPAGAAYHRRCSLWWQRYTETEALLRSLERLSVLFQSGETAGVDASKGKRLLPHKDIRLLEFFGFDTGGVACTEERGGGVVPAAEETLVRGALEELRSSQRTTAAEVARVAEENRVLQRRLAALASAVKGDAPALSAAPRTAPLNTLSSSAPANDEGGRRAKEVAAVVARRSPIARRETPPPFPSSSLSPAVRRVLRSLQEPDTAVPDLSSLSKEELLELKMATSMGFAPQPCRPSAAAAAAG